MFRGIPARLHDLLRAGIHGLAALDHYIGAQASEHLETPSPIATATHAVGLSLRRRLGDTVSRLWACRSPENGRAAPACFQF